MLNTSLHNPNVRDKPPVERFISMNRGINEGGDLPEELLRVRVCVCLRACIEQMFFPLLNIFVFYLTEFIWQHKKWALQNPRGRWQRSDTYILQPWQRGMATEIRRVTTKESTSWFTNITPSILYPILFHYIFVQVAMISGYDLMLAMWKTTRIISALLSQPVFSLSLQTWSVWFSCFSLSPWFMPLLLNVPSCFHSHPLTCHLSVLWLAVSSYSALGGRYPSSIPVEVAPNYWSKVKYIG